MVASPQRWPPTIPPLLDVHATPHQEVSTMASPATAVRGTFRDFQVQDLRRLELLFPSSWDTHACNGPLWTQLPCYEGAQAAVRRNALEGELRFQAVAPGELANSQYQLASHVVGVILDLGAVLECWPPHVKQKYCAVYSQHHDIYKWLCYTTEF